MKKQRMARGTAALVWMCALGLVPACTGGPSDGSSDGEQRVDDDDDDGDEEIEDEDFSDDNDDAADDNDDEDEDGEVEEDDDDEGDAAFDGSNADGDDDTAGDPSSEMPCLNDAGCPPGEYCHQGSFNKFCFRYRQPGEGCYDNADNLYRCDPDDGTCCVYEDVGEEPGHFARCAVEAALSDDEAGVCG